MVVMEPAVWFSSLAHGTSTLFSSQLTVPTILRLWWQDLVKTQQIRTHSLLSQSEYLNRKAIPSQDAEAWGM